MRPKRTILCVDDNEQALSIRKIMLETRGYRVLVFTDGQRALEVFKNGGIDLVISDFMMPGYNGAALITSIKEVSPETPAILFSGRVKFCDQEHKADLFLPKGTCAPVELLERIRVLLVKKRGPKKASDSTMNARRTAS
jgi:two-component system, OmpR family, response regulator CpxR